MSPKVAFSALLCIAASVASAQSINLTFPDDGDRQVWISSSLPKEAPSDSDGVHTLKFEATLPVSGQKPTDRVYIWDRKSGNLASKTVQEALKAAWVVKPGDFQAIAQVAIHLEHAGKPVAAGTVDLNDGSRTVTELLVPSSNGAVSFFGIKPGSLKITVHFKVAGKDGSPITQLLDAQLTRTTPIPMLTISVADAVDTVGTQAPVGSPAPPSGTTSTDAAAKGDGKASQKDSRGVAGVLGSLVIYIVALAGMGALIYYGVKYMQSNSDSVSSKLEQLGVQIPKPGDDPLTHPSQVSMPMPKAPAPVQKIILDDAAPDLMSSVSASTLLSDPRLVSQTGDSLMLAEGDLIVGRDVGLGLSLVGESTVSRKHAQVTRSGGSVSVKDFGSTNGTFVNGVQIQGEKRLQAGDTVQFGSVRFRFEG